MRARRVVRENEPFSGLTAADTVSLQERLGGLVRVRGRHVRIIRVVGHVLLPSGTLLCIQSAKASTAALLAWLAYADPSLRSLDIGARLERFGAEGDLGTLLARLFVAELDAAIRRSGLVLDYRRQHERGGFVRGAIDFRRLIRDGHNLAKITSTSWLRRRDTPLNRVFAAALARVRSDPMLRDAAPESVDALRTRFADVETRVDVALLEGKTPLQRTESAFQRAFDLARILLMHGGHGEGRETDGVAFLINLEGLFEATVARAFAESGRVRARPQAPLHYRIGLGGRPLKRRTLRIDVLCDGDGGPFVVDAKFKAKVSAGNVQQMVTYVAMTGARGGALVLPGAAGDDGLIEVVVRPSPEGTETIRLQVVHLDTTATSLEGWRRSAADLVARALAGTDKTTSSTVHRVEG